jgi:hypothetical protein
MLMTGELPTFEIASFDFADNAVPEHIEAYPAVPRYIGLFGVFGAIDGVKPYPLAVDVPSEDMAHLISNARISKQESDIQLYGYTDDVYILSPDGKHIRVYYGETL